MQKAAGWSGQGFQLTMPSSGPDLASAMARAFLREYLKTQSALQQRRISELLQRLVDLDELVSTLRTLDAAEAQNHLTACAEEVEVLSRELVESLKRWSRAGGAVVLAPPSDQGAESDPAPEAFAGENDDQDSSQADLIGPSAALPDPSESFFVSAGTEEPDDRDVDPFEAISSLGEAEVTPEMVEQLRDRWSQRWENTSVAGQAAVRALMQFQATVENLGLVLAAPGEPFPPVELYERINRNLAHLNTEWATLPTEQQIALLRYSAALLRHVESELDENDPLYRDAQRSFGKLVDFARERKPGWVHGLASDHTPESGSWLNDALGRERELRRLAGLDDSSQQRTPRVRRRADGSSSVPFDTFLREEGFLSSTGAKRARHFLEAHLIVPVAAAALTSDQAARAREHFRRQQFRVCAACMKVTESPTNTGLLVQVQAENCDICLGSANRRAAFRLAHAMRRRGFSRLLVIGGSDDAVAELRSLIDERKIELRHVESLKRASTRKEAQEQMGWAQVMAIWKATQLQHKVSEPYEKDQPPDLLAVSVVRRGVEALFDSVSERLEEWNAFQEESRTHGGAKAPPRVS